MSALPGRPPLLLLDAGNTLVYFEPTAVAAELARLGHPIPAAAIREALAPATRAYEALVYQGGGHERGWPVLVTELLVRAGLDAATARGLIPALREAQMEHNFWRTVPDGLPGTLARLRDRGTRLGVVSNSEGHIERTLHRAGYPQGLFEVVIDSSIEGVSKPDPEIFRRALVRLGARAEDGIYVGDVPSVDMVGARAAGLGAVLCDPFDVYPEYRDAPRVKDLPALLATWLAQ